MAKAIYIYGLLDPRIDKIGYVGKSIEPVQRYKTHVGRIRTMMTNYPNTWKSTVRNWSTKSRWIAELLCSGLEPKLVILGNLYTSEADAANVEKCWISRLLSEGHPLTNTHLPEDLRERRDDVIFEEAQALAREMFGL